MSDFSENPDPAAALSQVTDDTVELSEARLWAREQLLQGRLPEELIDKLIGQDWDDSNAEQIIEEARKETRGERGIVTRDDVVQHMNVDYRRATGGLSVAFRSGLFGLYGFTTGFMAALRSLHALKWFSERDRAKPGSQTRE